MVCYVLGIDAVYSVRSTSTFFRNVSAFDEVEETWRWKQYAPSKRRWISPTLHNFASLKMEISKATSGENLKSNKSKTFFFQIIIHMTISCLPQEFMTGLSLVSADMLNRTVCIQWTPPFQNAVCSVFPFCLHPPLHPSKRQYIKFAHASVTNCNKNTAGASVIWVRELQLCACATMVKLWRQHMWQRSCHCSMP